MISVYLHTRGRRQEGSDIAHERDRERDIMTGGRGQISLVVEESE